MNDPEHDVEQIGAALRASLSDVRAPHALRARIAAQRLGSLPTARRRRVPRLATGGVGAMPRAPRRGVRRLAATGLPVALLALAATLAVTIADDPPRASLADLARAAQRPATAHAPPARTDGTLPVAVGGVRFPAGDRTGGWRPVGVRSDTVAGRRMRTVTYAHDGRVAAYAIVDGPALALPADARPAPYEGIDAAVLRGAGTTIVTWRREGRTCILASANAGTGRLLELAARE